ncbi:MAG: methyltransferase domain-containing protein [bacterium]
MASERNGTVELVCGKKIMEIEGAALQRDAASYDRVVVDLGAGDGRFAYRLAHAHPAWFCLAVDPNANGMRERSYRAGRKASRGGISNVRFIRASVERLPAALDGLADEVSILYPWGSLLNAVILPRPELLARIARLGKPGALLRVKINALAVRDGTNGSGPKARMLTDGQAYDRLFSAYAVAGIRIAAVGSDHAEDVRTSWGRRLHHGGSTPDIAFDGIIVSE